MPITDIIANLEARLRGGRNRLRNRVFLCGVIRAATVGMGVVLFTLLLAAVLSDSPRWYASIAFGSLLTLIAVLVYFVALPLVRLPGLHSYARLVEEKIPAARSLMVNALELAPSLAKTRRLRGNASKDLAYALVAQAEVRSRELPLKHLDPQIMSKSWMRLILGVVVAWGVAGLFASGPLKESAWGLLNPDEAVARAVTLDVWPGDVQISSGADLHIEARVSGSGERPVLIARIAGKEQRIEMSQGEAPGSPSPAIDAPSYDAFQARIEAVSAPGIYRVQIGQRASPFYQIGLTGSAVPVSFDLTFEYPEYTGRPTEVQSVPRADLVALRGTKVRVGINLDRQIERVSWTLGDELVRESPRRWLGETEIRGTGNYDVVLHDTETPLSMTFRYEEIPDRAPVLTVLDPVGDMDLPVGQRIPLRITATDDFGLTRLDLVYEVGGQEAQRQTLFRWGEIPREATYGQMWDLSPIGLLPGQEVSFYFAIYDNDRISGPNVTESGRYVIRFPTLSEIYEMVEETHEDAITKLEDVAKEAEELARQVEETRRQLEQPGAGQQQGNSWQEKQAAKELADRQEAIAERLGEIADQFQQMTQDAAEREAFREEILAKMQEISKLMRELESEELKEAMEKLRQSLAEQNPQNLEKELRELEKNQEQLLRNLERTMELLKQIRQEEQLESAAKRAEELAERQEAINQQMESAETPQQQESLSEVEEQARSEVDQLQQDLEKLTQELEESGRQEASEKTDEAQENLKSEASPNMEQAQKSMKQGKQQQAQKSGQKAQQSLSQVARELRETAEAMTQQIDQEQIEAVRRAAQDLVNLSQRQEQALGEQGGDRTRARREEDLRAGTEQVADDLFEVAKKTPFLSEDAARHLGEALNNLERSADAFERGAGGDGERQGLSATNSLNQAVIALRDAEASMCESGGQPGQEGSQESLQQMVGRQSQLNRDSQSLAQRLAEQQRLMAGDSDAMKRLAARQEAIRRGIQESLDNNLDDGQILGRLDEAKEEMDEVAQLLKQQRLDQEVLDRQQRILSRLLDAQRSVNRREFEEKRESETGERVARDVPPELPRELLQPEARLNHDLLRARSERYSAEYRDLVESYLRRLQEER